MFAVISIVQDENKSWVSLFDFHNLDFNSHFPILVWNLPPSPSSMKPPICLVQIIWICYVSADMRTWKCCSKFEKSFAKVSRDKIQFTGALFGICIILVGHTVGQLIENLTLFKDFAAASSEITFGSYFFFIWLHLGKVLIVIFGSIAEFLAVTARSTWTKSNWISGNNSTNELTNS